MCKLTTVHLTTSVYVHSRYSGHFKIVKIFVYQTDISHYILTCKHEIQNDKTLNDTSIDIDTLGVGGNGQRSQSHVFDVFLHNIKI